MEFVKTFGLNPQLLLAQIVNFLILLYLLKRFLYKPVLTLLKERQKRIEKGLLDAKAAEEALDRARKEGQMIVKHASEEAAKMLQEAKKDGETLRESIEEQMRLYKERMVKEAREQIVQERQTLERELMKRVTLIAADIVERTLRAVVGSEDRKRIATYAQKQFAKHLTS